MSVNKRYILYFFQIIYNNDNNVNGNDKVKNKINTLKKLNFTFQYPFLAIFPKLKTKISIFKSKFIIKCKFH